jgi:hypothetical protein
MMATTAPMAMPAIAPPDIEEEPDAALVEELLPKEVVGASLAGGVGPLGETDDAVELSTFVESQCVNVLLLKA